MCDGTSGCVSLQESISDSENDVSSNNRIDFVQLFPSELSQKLFSYLPDLDLLSCSSCSSDWEKTIDENDLWKLMCKRRGWVNSPGETDPLKWTRVRSHISEDNPTLKFRSSPVYPASNNKLCDWAQYYRQCFHLENNWQNGKYALEGMEIPEENSQIQLTKDSAYNGKLLAVASNMGYIFLWSLEGIPKLIATIEPEENTLTVSIVAMELTSDFLIVVYENSQLHVYLLITGIQNNEDNKVYEHIYHTEMKASGTGSPTEYRMVCFEQVMGDDLESTLAAENDRQIIHQWIQNFVDWNITRTLVNNAIMFTVKDALLLLASENTIVLTGRDYRNILLFDMLGRRFIKSIDLPRTAKCCKCFLSSSKLFISAKKVLLPSALEHREVTAYYIFVLSLSDSFEEPEYTEINAMSKIVEIQADEKSERFAYVSHQGAVMGFDLNTEDFLFLHQSNGNVDTLAVSGDFILYHQFHGCIFALNWIGEVLYDIDAHCGIVRGIQCVHQFIISSGSATDLSIWDLKTGRRIYTIRHPPRLIYNFYADETKIITHGKQDPPVLVGFW